MKFKAPIEVESSLVDSSNSSGSAGQVLTSTGVGVDWIDPTLLPAESAEKVIQTVRFGEAVSKGDPLVITGYHGSNGPAIVERADATDTTKMPAYGVALEDYANNATGLMIAVGDFNDFDTSGYSVGDTLYVAVGGGMTNVKPTGTALIQNIGIVSRSNANNGDVEIVAIGRTNDVPNLPAGRLFVGTNDNTSLISDVVYIDDTNDRVGIGTTSPNTTLEVDGAISTTTSDYVQGTTGSRLLLETSGSGNTHSYIQAQNSGGTSSVEDLALQPYAGNVGIGTTSPTTGYGKVLQIHASGNGSTLRLTDSGSGSSIGNGLELLQSGMNSYIINRESGPMYFLTSSTTQMTISSTGDVGIGTTSPLEKLEVEGTMYATPVSYAPNQSKYALRMGANSSTAFDMGIKIKSTSGGSPYMSFTVPSYEDTIVLRSGKVGIGTTSPYEKLTVKGTDEYVATEQTSYAWGNTTTIGAKLGTNSSSGILDMRRWTGTGTNHGTVAITQTNVSGWGLDFKLDAKSTNTVATTSRMFISLAGNVGIGTTSPLAKFHINNTEAWSMVSLSTCNNVKNAFRITGRNSATNSVAIGSFNNTDYVMQVVNDAGNVSGKMLINPYGGNVGIGTTNPGSKLHVSSGGGANGDCVLLIEADADNTVEASNAILRLSQDGGAITGALSLTANNEMTLYNEQTGKLFLGVGNSTKMTIDNNGNVGIGTTSPSARLEVVAAVGSTGLAAQFRPATSGNNYGAKTIYVHNTPYGSGAVFNRAGTYDNLACSFQYQGSQKGSITIQPTSTSYNTTSDYRLKENLIPITDSIDRVKQLKPKRFNFIGDNTTVDGFIAHEAKEVVPESVTGEKDAVLPNGEADYQGIDQSKLVPLLTAALQDAIAKIEQLETRIQTLENNN